ncbi:hypothetical protein RJT34_12822 [Clitoria ternatea]|uniref:Uncharacterized protein n=1 Tax=Clitoria ternatea TaxID=43366 RepID=A0AAN9JMI9_CLITE
MRGSFLSFPHLLIPTRLLRTLNPLYFPSPKLSLNSLSLTNNTLKWLPPTFYFMLKPYSSSNALLSKLLAEPPSILNLSLSSDLILLYGGASSQVESIVLSIISMLSSPNDKFLGNVKAAFLGSKILWVC